MATKAKSLLDEVAGLIRAQPPGVRSWFDRLPEGAQEELKAVRAAYHAGEGAMAGAQKKAVALAVMDIAAGRGWKTSGVQGVIAWLNVRQP